MIINKLHTNVKNLKYFQGIFMTYRFLNIKTQCACYNMYRL